MSETSPGTDAGAYGGFTLGPLSLALPMSALREVLPCGSLTPLPCAAPGVIGGVDLRGVIVPVVDLRRVIGQASEVEAGSLALVVAHEGRLVALLAHSVTGVFDGSAEHLKLNPCTGPMAGVMAGSLQRPDDGRLVNLLSARALADLPQVPWVADPEIARRDRHDDLAARSVDESTRAMMLLRCGSLALCIDALVVQSALAAPCIEPSALAMGHCRGVVEHAGARVPVVDLQALCGVGRLDGATGLRAIVLRVEDAPVALLVNEVIDVVRVDPRDVIAVPPLGLPGSVRFSGAVPRAVLPAHLAARAPAGHFLVLDGPALCADLCLTSVARAMVDRRTAAVVAAAVGDAPAGREPLPGRSMVTFEMQVEMATPIDQLAEILPFEPEGSAFGADSALAGLLVSRGRSIPVMRLGALMGAAATDTPDAAVLVVQVDDRWMGFSVPRLRNIETARWERRLPSQGAACGDEVDQTLGTLDMALFGEGAAERSTRVLDLERLARAIVRRHAEAIAA